MQCKRRHNNCSILNVVIKLVLLIVSIGLCVSISFFIDALSYSSIRSTNSSFIKNAFADDLNQAKEEYETAQANLNIATKEYNVENEKASSLRSQVYDCAQKAIDAQNEKFKQQEEFNKIAVFEYKNNSALMFVNMLFEAHDLFGLLQNMHYSNKIMREKVDAMEAQEQARIKYEGAVGELNASLDAYNAQMASVRNNLTSAQEAVNKAYEKLKNAEDAANAKERVNPVPQPSGGPDVPGV